MVDVDFMLTSFLLCVKIKYILNVGGNCTWVEKF